MPDPGRQFGLKVDVHVDISEVKDVLTKAPGRMLTTIKQLFRETVAAIRKDIVREHLTGGTAPTRLARRSGRLISSLKTEVTGDSFETLQGTVGFVPPGSAYAPTHVLGTESKGGQMSDIYSRQGKFLPIPLKEAPGAFTVAGTARGGPRSGAYADTFVQRSRSGNLIIFGRLAHRRGAETGAGYGDIMPLFILKRAVSVPARVDMLEVAQRHVELLERTAQTRFVALLKQ